MKVLLTHRFFWPDTAPYAMMLRGIGDALAEAGHEVHVLSSMPSYRSDTRLSDTQYSETLGALKVQRIWVFGDEKRNPLRRLANVVLYCGALFATVLRLRPDVVVASTFPPVVAAWSASLAARLSGARFVYHVQDIHPEVSTYSGSRLGRGLPARLLTALDNQTLLRADAIVTLSEDMADTLQARGLGSLSITLINNSALEPDGEPTAPPPELVKPEGTTRVIFAGNLGRFQNLALLAEGVAQCFLTHPEIEMMFLGDGVALRELKARWGTHPQVRFAPFLPYAQAREIIRGSDVGLVSLAPDIYRVACPSKVATYRALGLKILALVEPESQMARQIRNDQQGAVSAAATPEAIAAAIEEVVEGLPRRIAYDAEQAHAAIMESWRTLMAELVEN